VALADRTFAELVDLLAAREPTPGGGSAAALTGALAAALAEMAAAFAELVDSRDRATRLRARMLELAEADTRSYGPVLLALRLERSDPERDARLREALSTAAEVPLAIAAATAELGELAATVAPASNPHLLGDVTAAAILAEAAAHAAARLVELNLAGSPADPRLREVEAFAERASAARASLPR
jgi:formiminotetrahydrofolate cyclodeaminase